MMSVMKMNDGANTMPMNTAGTRSNNQLHNGMHQWVTCVIYFCFGFVVQSREDLHLQSKLCRFKLISMPRGKRKSHFGRNIKGGKQKQSRYDYVAARESIGLPGTNSQQITSASMATDDNPTPSIRSPPKKVVKAMLQQEKIRSSQLESHNNKLQTGLRSEQRKNASRKKPMKK